MIRTVCTCCDAEIDVPAAGRNTCPACGHETVCFAPPAPTWTEPEMLKLIGVTARVSKRVGVRRGFTRGFAAGLLVAATLYWACNLAARYLF